VTRNARGAAKRSFPHELLREAPHQFSVLSTTFSSTNALHHPHNPSHWRHSWITDVGHRSAVFICPSTVIVMHYVGRSRTRACKYLALKLFYYCPCESTHRCDTEKSLGFIYFCVVVLILRCIGHAMSPASASSASFTSTQCTWTCPRSGPPPTNPAKAKPAS
jgi:hypothetical protein